MYGIKSEPVFKTEMSQQPGGHQGPLPEVDLPAKVRNEHKIRNVEEANIVLNAYRLDVSQAVEKMFKFELKFTGQIPPETEKDLSRGPRNDVANQARRQLLWEMFQQMITKNTSTFGGDRDFRNYVYDCGINFYSTTNLGMTMGESRTFDIDRNTLPPAQNVYLGKRIEGITANLLYCEEIQLRELGQFGETRSRSAVQFLDILSNQEIIRRSGYYIFQSKMFEKNSEIKVQNDPRILKEGMQKNVRIVGDTLKGATPIIQIDPKKSAFFPEMIVAEFLSNFLTGREHDLGRKIFSQMRQATKQVKGLSVITLHLEHPRTFTVNGLTDKPAKDITFECEGRGRISVVDYIEGRYPTRIRYPDLPCVIEKMPSKSGIKESYYPIELVKIVAGQRVNFDQQTPVLVEQMIRNCQALPAQFKLLNEKQKNNAFITSGNPFFRAHNVRVDSDILMASGQVLHPPAITYEGNDRDQADPSGNLQWKLPQNRRFVSGGSTPNTWVAAIFQNGVDGQQCDQFIKTFIQAANRRGMRAGPPKRYEQFSTTDEQAIREKFDLYKKNDARYVMFFTRDKLDPVHHTMKLMEIEFGIITQHISKMTMEKALGNRGAFLVIDNLLLKFNQKLGGINHGLATSNAMATANRFTSDVVKDDWIRESRMFIGLDMSHAAPQSLFERQKDEKPTEPTIVSMAYTLGHPLKMRGTYWAQQPRETSILPTQLVTSLESALETYFKEVGNFPQHIMVFRGGVSEGEYQKVATSEFGAFQTAFKELEQKHSNFQLPQVTIIVVQQQSNYRIVPSRVDTRGKPREQNVRAGTVVDERIMHPVFTEFLLVGHHTIQGTAHPSRCTVVVDTCNPRVTLEELEYVSYHLCYAHGIVCSPVSVPAPLMAAADLKKRGRNNWKVANFGDDRSSQGCRFKGDGSELFFISMTKELKPSIPTKFWA
ncbi:piwi domain-containing protein [Ditylenchus destructor]|nr:piwi domain-containing protein [Ditylenchus destructor]